MRSWFVFGMMVGAACGGSSDFEEKTFAELDKNDVDELCQWTKSQLYDPAELKRCAGDAELPVSGQTLRGLDCVEPTWANVQQLKSAEPGRCHSLAVRDFQTCVRQMTAQCQMFADDFLPGCPEELKLCRLLEMEIPHPMIPRP